MRISTITGYAIGPIVGGLLSLITLPVLAWVFPAEEIGRFSMLQVALGFSTLAFSFGLDTAYVREYHLAKNSHSLFLMTILPGLALIILASGIILAFLPELLTKSLYGLTSTTIASITGVCVLAAFLIRHLSLILRMQERSLTFSIAQILPRTLLLSFALTFAAFGFQGSFIWLLSAQGCALLLALGIIAFLTRQDWKPALAATFNWEKFSPLLAFGAPLFVAGLATWGLNAIDRIFLRATTSYAELAIFSVASSFAGGMAILASVFNTIWAPQVFKWEAEGVDLAIISTTAQQLIAVIFMVMCIAGGSSWVLAYLLPSEYADVPRILLGCTLAPLLYTLSEVTGIGIALTRKTYFSIIISLIALAFCVVMAYLLIPRYGAFGAMTTTASAFWVFFLLRTEISTRVWQPIPRMLLHFQVIGLLVTTISLSYLADKLPKLCITVWWLLFFSVLFLYRHRLTNFLTFLKNRVWPMSPK